MALLMESHANDLGPVGGNGGSTFVSECRPNDAVVALSMRSGTAVDAVRVVCAPLNEEKTRWAAPTTYSPTDFFGGTGGGPQLIACQRNDAIVAVHVYTGHAGIPYVVTHVSITCANLAAPANTYVVVPQQVAGLVDSDQELSCHGNGWVTAVLGAYGNYVDRLGVRCGLPPTPSPDLFKVCNEYASSMDAKLSEARNLSCGFIHGSGGWDVNRDSFVKQCVDVKGGVGIKSNERGLQKLLDACKSAQPVGGGQTAVSPNGTWVYKQPNGVDSPQNHAAEVPPGGQVTIVECGNPKGWCQVSKPAAGFVWGADVNR
jgi:hypothetical protein